jgi:drug/metabolite transporter (DMT)-like permease
MLSIPGSLRDMLNRGEIYLFSRAFIEDIPKRLTGPGRFRFILQPAMAIILGILGGLADARAGRPPYLYGIILHRELRGELVRSGYTTIANLLLMGILLDSIFQWVILGVSHPGPALLLGPVLIVFPYAVARALSNRLSRKGKPPNRAESGAKSANSPGT